MTSISRAIPVRCLARPLAGGLVVPYVSLIHNEHAVFGSLDADRAQHAFLQRLCQICSQPLEERFWAATRYRAQLVGPKLVHSSLPSTPSWAACSSAWSR